MKVVVKTPQKPLSDSEVYCIEQDMMRRGLYDVYAQYVAEGSSPRAAAMYAAQAAPGVRNTGDDFMRRENFRMKTMDEQQRDEIVAIAKKAGINTQGKTYNGQLGKYNDPMAWVADQSDVKEAAKAKGLTIEGMVNYTAPQKPPKKPRLAKDIVDRIEKRKRLQDQSLNERCTKNNNARRELREQIREKHGPRKD